MRAPKAKWFKRSRRCVHPLAFSAAWAIMRFIRAQDSLTRLLGTAGIRILRHATASIRSQGESVNLIGVDFQGCHNCPTFPPQDYLRGVEPLVLPDTVNILLSH